MNPSRIRILFIARNREFFRDRAAFGWNFLFPFLIIAGFWFIFSGERHQQYKVGVFPPAPRNADSGLPSRFAEFDLLEFVSFPDGPAGREKLKRHKIDFLVKRAESNQSYWVNDTSPRGRIVERIFLESVSKTPSDAVEKREVSGRETRYLDWFFPGILAMNIMFSAMWGLGWVIVRYRKIGVLKRLKVTPVTALEYLTAQMLSRIFVLMFTVVVMWFGCDLLFDFRMNGPLLDFFAAFFVGTLSLCALGLVVSARGTSEEFVSGIINFVTWPMMFLSEIWFSIEGAPEWVQAFSKLLPLTHMLVAVRKIMNEGAGIVETWPQLSILAVMTVVFMALAAALFSWNR